MLIPPPPPAGKTPAARTSTSPRWPGPSRRSEEHTSELQSQSNLVCRLLLEKKNAAASLDHPNIVPIYEIGEHEGRHFFSMKLIAGRTLTRESGGSPIPPRRVGRLLARLAPA